jgi:hypothetical protein
MTILWVIVGVVVILVIWAVASAFSGRPAPKTHLDTPPPPPIAEPPEQDLPRARSWEDGPTVGVSKSFGKGGEPSGVSTDAGGVATAGYDEDFERLKQARPFEPRATKLDLGAAGEEEKEKEEE